MKNIKRSFMCLGITIALSSNGVLANKVNDDINNIVETNRVIIKYKPMTSDVLNVENQEIRQVDTAGVLHSATGSKSRYIRTLSTGEEVYELDEWKNSEELGLILNGLEGDPQIEFAELDLILHPLDMPNDPRISELWGVSKNDGGINAAGVWSSYTGKNTVVAVIDTGYASHSDLESNMLPGWDFITDPMMANDGDGRDNDASDPGDWVLESQCRQNSRANDSSWHGTHVAGTIAAVANNNKGIAGVSYDAKIVPVRVLGRCGGYTSDIADGIIWASGGDVPGADINSNPAQVINMSLGGEGSCSRITQNAINLAVEKGTTIVVAAGNSNRNADNYTPASCANVITVAAVNNLGSRSYYSNFGEVVDIAAPGGEYTKIGKKEAILSTINNGKKEPTTEGYSYYQGTSMAAPHVAGLAALLYQADPMITPGKVEEIIKQSSREFPNPNQCIGCGSGLADASAAIKLFNTGDIPKPSLEEWDKNKIYLKGNEVSYNSIRFLSKWWNINEIPGKDEWGPWEKIKN
jgi:serine protease